MRVLCALLFLGVGLSTAGSAEPPAADSVSDYVAFRLFFAAVAENSSATPAEAARQDVKLNPIQLSGADKAVLIKALAGFKGKLQNGKQMPQTTSFSAIVHSTLADLQAQMSMDGFQRLYAHVRLQKQYMRALPFPAPVTASHSTHSAISHQQ